MLVVMSHRCAVIWLTASLCRASRFSASRQRAPYLFQPGINQGVLRSQCVPGLGTRTLDTPASMSFWMRSRNAPKPMTPTIKRCREQDALEGEASTKPHLALGEEGHYQLEEAAWTYLNVSIISNSWQ